jgi:hypothetical protein
MVRDGTGFSFGQQDGDDSAWVLKKPAALRTQNVPIRPVHFMGRPMSEDSTLIP